jgi:hypothetical protein
MKEVIEPLEDSPCSLASLDQTRAPNEKIEKTPLAFFAR